jgi:hypothetical protein
MSFSKFVRKPSFKIVAQMPIPILITFLIITCMFVVFTMESLGLSNRIKNIELRETPFDKSILTKLNKAREGTQMIDNDDLVNVQRVYVKSLIDKQEIHFKMLYESVYDSEDEFYDF